MPALGLFAVIYLMQNFNFIKMNISINKEPVHLKANNSYIVIDGVYLNDLKGEISKLDFNMLYEEIREKIFIYNDNPFAEFIADSDRFDIDRIKQVGPKEGGGSADTQIFSSDTGLLVLCDKFYLPEFVELFDYEILVDSSELIDRLFWERIISKFPEASFGLIVSPGINSGCDFVGSGLYTIVE